MRDLTPEEQARKEYAEAQSYPVTFTYDQTVAAVAALFIAADELQNMAPEHKAQRDQVRNTAADIKALLETAVAIIKVRDGIIGADRGYHVGLTFKWAEQFRKAGVPIPEGMNVEEPNVLDFLRELAKAGPVTVGPGLAKSIDDGDLSLPKSALN